MHQIIEFDDIYNFKEWYASKNLSVRWFHTWFQTRDKPISNVKNVRYISVKNTKFIFLIHKILYIMLSFATVFPCNNLCTIFMSWGKTSGEADAGNTRVTLQRELFIMRGHFQDVGFSYHVVKKPTWRHDDSGSLILEILWTASVVSTVKKPFNATKASKHLNKIDKYNPSRLMHTISIAKLKSYTQRVKIVRSASRMTIYRVKTYTLYLKISFARLIFHLPENTSLR